MTPTHIPVAVVEGGALDAELLVAVLGVPDLDGDPVQVDVDLGLVCQPAIRYVRLPTWHQDE